MKIKIIEKSYDDVMALPQEKHRNPVKPNIFFRTLLKVVSIPGLVSADFECKRIGMERLSKKEPCLYLMNHSSFIDLEIAAGILYPRPFNIVATTDGFVGKNWLMRQIGCIPTKKFVLDLTLIRDIRRALKTNKSSVLMFPEAGYSFDGTSTVLPEALGKFVKMIGVPVIMITTYGAFTRQPLYNDLHKRDVKVTAEMKYLLSANEIADLDSDTIGKKINECFAFDGFKWQQENKIKVDNSDRADKLNRLLYKCPSCLADGEMLGEGTRLVCKKCGKEYELDEYGYMKAINGETEFSHIPDWYEWERECVRQELVEDKYSLDLPVDICMAVDTKHIYHVGEGRLRHNKEGFFLEGCDGKLNYHHTPITSYTICSDFNFYEIGDVISFGNSKALYYCFPKTDRDVVAKARLATEELYKIVSAEKKAKAELKKREREEKSLKA